MRKGVVENSSFGCGISLVDKFADCERKVCQLDSVNDAIVEMLKVLSFLEVDFEKSLREFIYALFRFEYGKTMVYYGETKYRFSRCEMLRGNEGNNYKNGRLFAFFGYDKGGVETRITSAFVTANPLTVTWLEGGERIEVCDV